MKDIYTTGYGWISHRGNVLGCDCYGHLGTLAAWTDVRDALPQIAATLERLDDIRKESEDLIANGEHPERHCYEMACDREKSKIRDALLSAGFVRIGTSLRTETIEAEGKSHAILTRMAKIRSIVKEYNAQHGEDYRLRTHPVAAKK